MRKRRSIWTLAVVLGALGGLSWYLFGELYHFEVVQPGVFYRDGFQGMRRLKNAYRRYPFKTIINLQSEKDIAIQYKHAVEAERQFCLRNGIRWIHIPMKQSKPPTKEQMAQLVEIVRAPENQPVLAHDSQGVIRMGMMVAVWQKEGMKYSYEQCRDAFLWFGHPPKKALIDFVDEIYGKTASGSAVAAVPADFEPD